MQFLNNGPDVPDRLLQAHEDGRVVFFCGAGISFSAGLPGFSGLVEKLYDKVGETQNDVEKTVFKRDQYDNVIGLLEQRIAGGRKTVRNHLSEILKPTLSALRAKQTHEALLILARTRGRDPRHRLVTTNFDHLFELTREPHVPTYCAPFLPVPKNRWNGLVYLHGLLPEENDAAAEDKLDQLVLSSGDFGLAYLVEGWAARFVSELFRSYTVCFVGYSINDPVLRYMMDARAADRLRGEKDLPEAFAFGTVNSDKQKQAADEWKAKNVTPILYAEDAEHTRLHQTLHAWAETYRDGVLGKQRIIDKYAMAQPQASMKEDDFVGRVLWALSDPCGKPARHFAQLEPPPPFEWLDALIERRFGRQHLSNFDIGPESKPDDEFSFGMLDRPGRASRTPPMSIVQQGFAEWDEIMFHLSRWLVKYLDEPKLFLWAANQRSPLDPQFARLVARGLDEQPVRPQMQKLWRLMLAGKVRTERHGDFYGWKERIRCYGLTLTLRLELRKLLTPRLEFSGPFRCFARPSDTAPAIRELVDWEIVLGADHVHSMLKDLQKILPAGESLAPLLPDLTALLHDALDLMRELEGATDDEDGTDVEHPSISEHPQNRHYHDWTTLIDLARDAWLATADTCPNRALLEIERWLTIPYPLFKRLAFFAATDERVVTLGQALEWLLMDDCQWLWASGTRREAIRLMLALAPKLASDDANILQDAILQGPPRYHPRPDDPYAEDWQRFADHAVWRRLAKIQAAGARLNEATRNRLQDLSEKYPYLELADDERDEFGVWMGDDSDWRTVVTTPKRRRDLVAWLRTNSKKGDTRQDDDWRERCRSDFPITSTALCQLAQNGEWSTKHWRQALQVWSDERLAKSSFRHMGRLLSTAPDDRLKELAYPLGHWLKAVARTVGHDRGALLTLAKRILELHRDGIPEQTDAPVNAAINHPVGIATQAILVWWRYRQGLEDNQGIINNDIRPVLEDLCDTDVASFRHGRLILAQNAITLFRVDPCWAGDHVLPLFDWGQSEEEARAAWCGFLCTARPHEAFLVAIMPHFIATSSHYDKVGMFAEKYAALLASAALEPGDWFSEQELANATRSLPEEGLSAALQFVIRSLPGADEQHDEYWQYRVLPYLHRVWPKSANFFSPRISAQFVELCIAAAGRFGEAVDTVHDWLQPISASTSSFVLSKLFNSGLCENFPCKALTLLHAVVNNPGEWGATRLPQCLDEIEKACSALAQDHRMRYLRND